MAPAQVWNEDPGQLLAGPWSDAEFLANLEQYLAMAAAWREEFLASMETAPAAPREA